MAENSWQRLGQREKQILAILRRSDGPLTIREVMNELRDSGDELAYTTISTILTRLFEKEFVDRTEKTHSGSVCYVYDFKNEDLRKRLVNGVVEDVALVLGESGLERLAEQVTKKRQRAQENNQNRD